MGKPNAPHDCFVCAFAPITIAGIFTGLGNLTSSCEHSKRPSCPLYKKSVFLLALNWAIVAYCAYGTLWNGYHLWYSTGELDIYQHLTDSLFCFNAIVFGMGTILRAEEYAEVLNRWVVIVEKRDVNTFLLSGKDIMSVRKEGWIFALGLLSIYVLGVSATVARYETVKILNVVIPAVSNMMPVFQLINKCSIAIAMYRGAEHSVKVALKKRLQFGPCAAYNFSFEVLVLRSVYEKIYRNFKMTTSLYHRELVFATVMVLLWLIINIFVLDVLWDTGTYEPRHIYFQLRTYGVIIVFTFAVYRIEQLAHANEGILSALFKYPISKLEAEEAAQVEMLMATLKIQKSIFRACDVITFGTRMLASVAGTVVMYVLVCLDFHKTWGK